MSPTTLQQFIVMAAAGALFVVALRTARSGRLSFGNAVLWASIAGIAMTGALLIPRADRIASTLGVIPAALFAGVATSVLAGIVLLLSFRVTRLEDSLQRVLEVVATSSIEPPVPEPSSGGRGVPVLVIVPAYNEARSVGEVAARLVNAGLPTLVVDDGSTDGTPEVARQAGASVLRLPTNVGVGGALRAGAAHAVRLGYPRIVQCDADGQHPLEEVMRVIAAHQASGAQLLIGSRFTSPGSRRTIPMARRLAMKTLAILASRSAGQPLSDPTSGLRVISEPLLSQVARHLPRHYLGDTFELAVSAGRAGFEIREEHVAMLPRAYGESSASVPEAVALTLRAVLVVLLGAHLPFRTGSAPREASEG